MEIWIWTTLVAATTQTLRSAGQKQMKSVMGDFGASYIQILLCPALCLYLAVCRDERNRSGDTANHPKFLAVGEHWRHDSGYFHCSTYHLI